MKTQETTIRARVKKSSAQKAERIFSKLGISTEEAINMFLAQVVARRGIPFTVTLSGVEEDGTFWSDKIRRESLTEIYGD